MGDFLNKIMGSMDKYFEAASIKTCEIADTAKIKLEIHSLNKDKKEALIKIGKMVYSMYLKDKFNQQKIAERCSEIIKLDKEIKLKEEEMERVHGNARKYYKKHHRRRPDSIWSPGEEQIVKDRDKGENKGSKTAEEDEKVSE